MRRKTVLLLAVAVGVGGLGPVLAQRSRERASSVEGRARDLALDMREARQLLKSVLEAAGKPGGSTAREREGRRDSDDNRRRLEDILERSEREARDLERDVKRLQDELRFEQDRRNDSPYDGRVRRVISERDFRELTNAIRQKNLSGDKVSLIRLASQSEWFSCTQLRELLKLVSFSSDQEKVAVMVHPRLVDPARFYTLSDAFRFTSSWRSVCEKLRLPL